MKETKKIHGDVEVRDALRWIGDILDWSQIQYIVLGNFVEQVMLEKPIELEKIEIGIHKNAWNDTTKSLFRTFLPNIDTEDLHLEYNGVPIELKIIQKNYEFFKNPDFVFYWTDEYHIPNPWQKYFKSRYLIS